MNQLLNRMIIHETLSEMLSCLIYFQSIISNYSQLKNNWCIFENDNSETQNNGTNLLQNIYIYKLLCKFFGKIVRHLVQLEI